MFSKSVFYDLRHWSRLAVFLLTGTIHAYGQQDIAFISDTQAPMWVEKIVLKSNNNIQATALAFSDILKKRPSSLFILGDVVTLGYKHKKWSRMDVYLDSCRKAGIHVSALLGNHDVMTRSKKGESQFQRRFPNHNRTGFYQVVDSIAVIFLNSNFSKLSHEDLDAQQVWFQNTLNALDADPAIVITLVACHHAPFTNSKIVGSSQSVQEHFVPAFIKSRKAQLFITGHSHNYEQFKYQGKDFMVIGGGGGLTQPLSNSENQLNDISKSYKPQFHYLVVQRNQQTLCLTSRYLKDDFSGFEDGLSYSLSVH